MSMIEQSDIYRDARTAEDEVNELTKTLSVQLYYRVGLKVKHSSAVISHRIMTVDRLYSYRLKLNELENVRREADVTIKLLKTLEISAPTDELIGKYDDIIKHSWELTASLQGQLTGRVEAMQ